MPTRFQLGWHNSKKKILRFLTDLIKLSRWIKQIIDINGTKGEDI